MLITEIILQLWRMLVCQYVYIMFFLPHYSCRVTSYLSPLITRLQIHFLSKILQFNFLSKILQHPFSVWCSIPTAV